MTNAAPRACQSDGALHLSLLFTNLRSVGSSGLVKVDDSSMCMLNLCDRATYAAFCLAIFLFAPDPAYSYRIQNNAVWMGATYIANLFVGMT